MTVAGVMSGTSADGIDVAAGADCARKVGSRSSRCWRMRDFPFLRRCGAQVLAAMNAQSTSTAELARLNWRLGLAYAEAVKETARRHKAASSTSLAATGKRSIISRARRRMRAGSLPARGRRARRRRLLPRSAFPCLEFPAGGYAGRRAGRAAGSAARLRSVCRCQARARSAEYRRHCELDGNSCRRQRRRCDRLRYRAGKYGDRLAGAKTVRQAIRSQWRIGGEGRGDRAGAGGGAAPSVFPAEAAARPRDASSLGGSTPRIFWPSAGEHSKNPEDALATATALTAETIARSYARFVRPQMKGATWTSLSPAAGRGTKR